MDGGSHRKSVFAVVNENICEDIVDCANRSYPFEFEKCPSDDIAVDFKVNLYAVVDLHENELSESRSFGSKDMFGHGASPVVLVLLAERDMFFIA